MSSSSESRYSILLNMHLLICIIARICTDWNLYSNKAFVEAKLIVTVSVVFVCSEIIILSYTNTALMIKEILINGRHINNYLSRATCKWLLTFILFFSDHKNVDPRKWTQIHVFEHTKCRNYKKKNCTGFPLSSSGVPEKTKKVSVGKVGKNDLALWRFQLHAAYKVFNINIIKIVLNSFRMF